MSHYRLVIGASSHWIVKKLNLQVKLADPQCMFRLDKLDEFQNEAYENAKIYKKRTKMLHDKRIPRREFKLGE